MDERQELPRPLTDTDFWLGVLERRGWAEIDDKALFRAFMERDPNVDPEVLRGVLDRLLRLVAQIASVTARKRGLSDERDIRQVKRHVRDEVLKGIALPRGSVGRGLREAAFGRVLFIAASETRKIRGRHKLAERDAFRIWIARGSHEDAPDRELMRKDVLRALDEVATPAQRRTIKLLIDENSVGEVAASEVTCKKTVHNRVKAFLRLYNA